MKLQPLVEFPIMTSTLPVCPICNKEIQDKNETIQVDEKTYHINCVKNEPVVEAVQNTDEKEG